MIHFVYHFIVNVARMDHFNNFTCVDNDIILSPDLLELQRVSYSSLVEYPNLQSEENLSILMNFIVIVVIVIIIIIKLAIFLNKFISFLFFLRFLQTDQMSFVTMKK